MGGEGDEDSTAVGGERTRLLPVVAGAAFVASLPIGPYGRFGRTVVRRDDDPHHLIEQPPTRPSTDEGNRRCRRRRTASGGRPPAASKGARIVEFRKRSGAVGRRRGARSGGGGARGEEDKGTLRGWVEVSIREATSSLTGVEGVEDGVAPIDPSSNFDFDFDFERGGLERGYRRRDRDRTVRISR